jgi:hypothetical protein
MEMDWSERDALEQGWDRPQTADWFALMGALLLATSNRIE